MMNSNETFDMPHVSVDDSQKNLKHKNFAADLHSASEEETCQQFDSGTVDEISGENFGGSRTSELLPAQEFKNRGTSEEASAQQIHNRWPSDEMSTQQLDNRRASEQVPSQHFDNRKTSDDVPSQQFDRDKRAQFARHCCNMIMLPCLIFQGTISLPYMLPSNCTYSEFPEVESCLNRLCCPLQCLCYPAFCCLLVMPVMGLDDPNIDYYSTLNMFCVSRCPACMYCCICMIEIPMDLHFMDENEDASKNRKTSSLNEPLNRSLFTTVTV